MRRELPSEHQRKHWAETKGAATWRSEPGPLQERTEHAKRLRLVMDEGRGHSGAGEGLDWKRCFKKRGNKAPTMQFGLPPLRPTT